MTSQVYELGPYTGNMYSAGQRLIGIVAGAILISGILWVVAGATGGFRVPLSVGNVLLLALGVGFGLFGIMVSLMRYGPGPSSLRVEGTLLRWNYTAFPARVRTVDLGSTKVSMRFGQNLMGIEDGSFFDIHLWYPSARLSPEVMDAIVSLSKARGLSIKRWPRPGGRKGEMIRIFREG